MADFFQGLIGNIIDLIRWGSLGKKEGKTVYWPVLNIHRGQKRNN